MDRDNTIARLENIAKHAVHTAGEDIFILSLDDGLAIHEAIEALKAQLTHEGTTSDLISRQQALDIFDDYNVSVENGELEAYSRDRKRLCDLPPIQPVATDTNVGNNSEIPNSWDCISRQQAIDIVVFECGKWTGLAKEISKRLKRLPSAQPEPKEGHWIDKGWDGDWAWQIDGRGNCWRVIECSECGKRVLVESNYCPNCGAKMRGEQHETD